MRFADSKISLQTPKQKKKQPATGVYRALPSAGIRRPNTGPMAHKDVPEDPCRPKLLGMNGLKALGKKGGSHGYSSTGLGSRVADSFSVDLSRPTALFPVHVNFLHQLMLGGARHGA